MSQHHYKRSECRICNSENLVKVIELKATPPADSYLRDPGQASQMPMLPLDVYLCKKCGLVQLLDVVAPEAIYKDYIYETSSSLGLVEHFRRYAEDVQNVVGKQEESLVVDIGSNDGSLLKQFKDLGYRVLGVDPAVAIADKATVSGIETLAAFFSIDTAKEMAQNYGKAKIVTANNMLANIDEINSFISAICLLLDENGTLVIETPHVGLLMDGMVFDFIYHEHLSYFCLESIEHLLGLHEMEIYHVVQSGSKGGSIRYFCAKKKAKKTQWASVSYFRTFELEKALGEVQTYSEFMQRVEGQIRILQAYLQLPENNNKTMAAYGASATSTTLLYHANLQNSVSFFVDDYAAKQGTYSPGAAVPVHSASYLNDLDANNLIIIILAWRYASQIIEKCKEAAAAGAKIIVPFPEFFIYDFAKG